MTTTTAAPERIRAAARRLIGTAIELREREASRAEVAGRVYLEAVELFEAVTEIETNHEREGTR